MLDILYLSNTSVYTLEVLWPTVCLWTTVVLMYVAYLDEMENWEWLKIYTQTYYSKVIKHTIHGHGCSVFCRNICPWEIGSKRKAYILHHRNSQGVTVQ